MAVLDPPPNDDGRKKEDKQQFSMDYMPNMKGLPLHHQLAIRKQMAVLKNASREQLFYTVCEYMSQSYRLRNLREELPPPDSIF